MTTRANAIVNSLMRLDRAGDAHSAANQKLLAAAVAVTAHVAERVGEGATLPRGYTTEGFGLYIPGRERLHGPCLTWNRLMYHYTQDRITLEAARHLAHDVADGWLDEVAAYLEARTTEAERANTTLAARLPEP
jgi:hypothetical protein